jgi:hypothetical protein
MMFLQSIELILPQITVNQDFYRKICQGFTTYITNHIHDLESYGFAIEQVQTWKLFTDEEYSALLEINSPIEGKPDPMKLYPRK